MIASFLLDLRRSRSLVLWSAIIVAAYAGTMALFYPIMVENTALLDEYLDLFPEGFLIAFGMSGSLAEPGVFFNTYIGTWLWPIVAAVIGILLATRPVAVDQDRGFLDLPLSTPVTRTRYLAAAIGGQIVVLALLSVVTVASVLAVGAIVAAGFDAGRFALVIPSAFLLGCAVAAVATLLSVVTLSRGIAGGITAAILLAMYLMNIVGRLQADLEWLTALSAFGYFDTGAIIDTGAVPWTDLGVFAVVAILGWTGSLILFERRDLAA
jgi:ABC-2 type transport system permease protein